MYVIYLKFRIIIVLEKDSPEPLLKYGKLYIVYLGAKVWNSLPSVFKEAVSLNDFRSLLVKWEHRDLWFYL
jgi:hypothetical protein